MKKAKSKNNMNIIETDRIWKKLKTKSAIMKMLFSEYSRDLCTETSMKYGPIFVLRVVCYSSDAV